MSDEMKKQVEKMVAQIGKMEIERLAQSAEAVDVGAVEKIVAIVNENSRHDVDENGKVTIAIVDKATGEKSGLTVGEYIDQLKADSATGYLFKGGAKSTAASGLTTEQNPWLPQFHSLAEQARIMKADPAYGARLRDAAKNIADTSNPFMPGAGHNLTKQAILLRENPTLAAQLKAEAAPKEKNPWIKSQENLTSQILISKNDPAKAARMKAEAALVNPPKKDYRFIPPQGSFKRCAPYEG
ncbi:MAG: hypothetical protein ACYC7K_00460 [Desulfobacteria bacterium]